MTQANAAGFHIPRAPGRTFCRTPQDGLQPVTVPLFPELRGILFPIVALFICSVYCSRLLLWCQVNSPDLNTSAFFMKYPTPEYTVVTRITT